MGIINSIKNLFAEEKKQEANPVKKKEKSYSVEVALSLLGEVKPKELVKSFEFKKVDLPIGVIPAGANAPVNLAMDSQTITYLNGSQFSGGGFPGYAYLSQLATRAEYRAFASSLSIEITRKWIELYADDSENDETREKIKALNKAIADFGLREVIQRAAEHDALFGRAQIYIDIKGANRAKPLILSDKTIEKGSLVRIVTVEPMWTSPSAYNAIDPAAPDFYKPTQWFVLGQETHASRLLTVITRPLPDMLKPAYNFSGMSLSQLAEPYVDNWLRTRQSVSDLINNFSITALATSMDQILSGDDDGDVVDVFKRAELFTKTRSNRGLMMLDKSREELVQINTPLSGLHELQAQSQEHMCVSKGTLIETRRGHVPIELVNIDDEVLTRNGYAPVKWAGVTGLAVNFVEIVTRNSILRVTKEHPIWVESNQNFVPAGNVNLSNLLIKSRAWESMVSQLHGEADCGATPSKDITETQKEVGCFTGFFTNPISEKYPKDLTFITKMKTRLTTHWKTWFCLQDQNIPPSMKRKGGLFSLMGLLIANYVKSVVQCICRNGQQDQNFVQRNAEHHPIEIKNVRNVVLNNFEQVYNLQVADGFLPEFFANGILVHNCSVSRIPAMILTGISPSGLNASSDGEIRVFYDWIAAQQEAYWRYPIETILKIMQLDLFGSIDESIKFKFMPLYQLNEKEQAEVREIQSRVDSAYVAAGVISGQEVREKVALDPNSGYNGIDTSEALDLPEEYPEGGDLDIRLLSEIKSQLENGQSNQDDSI